MIILHVNISSLKIFISNVGFLVLSLYIWNFFLVILKMVVLYDVTTCTLFLVFKPGLKSPS